jgi:hypothetical protein
LLDISQHFIIFTVSSPLSLFCFHNTHATLLSFQPLPLLASHWPLATISWNIIKPVFIIGHGHYLLAGHYCHGYWPAIIE